MSTTPRPPLSVIVLYALGQLGWSLASYGAGNLLVYFYMPSETPDSTSFPPFIYQGAVLGLLTIIGLVNFGSRIFDGFTDPLIANWSDRLSSKRGKRKRFMLIAAIPFALFSFLLFYPISPNNSALNATWLLICILLFYFFMTLYVVPYTALISELGHHPNDRLTISTAISLTWALGFMIGNSAYALQSYLEQSLSSVIAFQWTIGLFASVALLLMLLPALFLPENKYCQQQNTAINIRQSIAAVFSNRRFRLFTIADLMYWLALTFIQIGISYYIVLLMGLDKAEATLFMTIAFLLSFLCYLPVNFAARRWGKVRIIRLAFPIFALLFGLTWLIGWIVPFHNVLFYFLALCSALPLAVFSILPNALIADIVHEHEEETGESLAGMFYGTRNLMMKLGISVANLIFPSLLLLGKSVDNPLGVRLSAFCAFGFCLIGWLIFQKIKTTPV